MTNAVGRGVRMVLMALLCWGGASGQANEPRRYHGAKLVQVKVTNQRELTLLESLGASIQNCRPGIGRTDVVVTPQQLAEIEQLGLPFRVVHEDVQALIDRERAVPLRADAFDDFFLDYHDYEGPESIVWYMTELVSRHPGLASMVNVGTTLEGRTIWGIRIANGPAADKPGVVYFGCEHAREWITTTIPTYFAAYLLDNYGTDARVTDLVDKVEFFLIPVFNADGYQYSRITDRYWRKNRRDNGNSTFGVDLNRNWGQGWGGPGSSSNSDSGIYRGPFAFSEPETQVLRDFFLAHPNIRAQLDIHSYSQLILWPYGHTPTLSEDHGVYQEIGADMRSLIQGVHGLTYAMGPVYSGIYPASGVSIDWTYAQLGVLSFSYELRDTGFYGFALPPEQIIPSNEELIPAMLHLTDSDWVRSEIRFEFPDGLPGMLTRNEETTVRIRLVAQSEAVVPGTARLYHRHQSTDAFVDSALVPLGGDLYEATLPAADCADVPEYYFSVDGDGGSTVTKPRSAPGEVFFADVTTGRVAFFQDNLDVDPGWTTQGQWAWGQPTGSGTGPGDPTSGFSGSNVYGYNLWGNYVNNLPATYLTTGAIDCSGRSNVHLSFHRWLGVESEQNYDQATIEVSYDGTDWAIIWWATDTGGNIVDSSWTQIELDISAVADGEPTVYVRWGMGPTDPGVVYAGWNIDDVVLSHTVCSNVEPPLADATPKNRYISFEPNNPAAATAYQIELLQSSHFPGSAGMVGWVGPPDENGVARVVDSRVDLIWPDETVDVGDCEIVPDATYAIRAIASGDSEMNPSAFSDPAMVATTGRPEPNDWADCVGNLIKVCSGDEVTPCLTAADCPGDDVCGVWSGPNSVVNFDDITAVLFAFERVAGYVYPPMTWVDVYGADFGDASVDPPDFVANFADIQHVVLAFEGGPYPFSDPLACP